MDVCTELGQHFAKQRAVTSLPGWRTLCAPVGLDSGLTGSLLPPRFESARLLGRGGMGAVFLAWDRLLCRHVAIKILAPEFAGDALARERFVREAALAGRLGAHPHIVTAHEAGEWEQRPYVAFEYMPNGSLAEQLRDKGTPPRPQALQWLAQAAAAVDHAHRAKVVHRDIKPANLLLDADGNLSVADFGVSRRDGEATLTAEGDVVGTAGYLAPGSPGALLSGRRLGAAAGNESRKDDQGGDAREIEVPHVRYPRWRKWRVLCP